MTDGIIQKVFDKYHTKHTCSVDRELSRHIEQELIAEIKKELSNEYWIVDKLIGDNQE